jgi:hypothetical protein
MHEVGSTENASVARCSASTINARG